MRRLLSLHSVGKVPAFIALSEWLVEGLQVASHVALVFVFFFVRPSVLPFRVSHRPGLFIGRPSAPVAFIRMTLRFLSVGGVVCGPVRGFPTGLGPFTSGRP